VVKEGGCLCGAVRYRVQGEPRASGICHCRTCRRAASAPTLPFAGFAVSDFAITYHDELRPDAMDIMTCSLDDPDALPPSFSVWVSDKLAWDTPAGDLPAYDKGRT
jgi:hypothetical protein